MNDLCISTILPEDARNVQRLLREHWGDVNIVSRGKIVDASTLPGFLCRDLKGNITGLITLNLKDGECEVVTLDAFKRGAGIGKALLRKAWEFSQLQNAQRLWLITTNDNTNAIQFYERMGMKIVAVHRGAISESRRLKPSIPLVGDNGIPIEDEIELELKQRNFD